MPTIRQNTPLHFCLQAHTLPSTCRGRFHQNLSPWLQWNLRWRRHRFRAFSTGMRRYVAIPTIQCLPPQGLIFLCARNPLKLNWMGFRLVHAPHFFPESSRSLNVAAGGKWREHSWSLRNYSLTPFKLATPLYETYTLTFICNFSCKMFCCLAVFCIEDKPRLNDAPQPFIP